MSQQRPPEEPPQEPPKPPRPPERPPGRRAVRLTFAYDASGVRLIDRQLIEKHVPPPDEEQVTSPGAVSMELLAPDGSVRFRRNIPEAIPQDVEVFEPEVDHGVRRRPGPPPSGVFTVIVPDDDEATEVALLAGEQAAPPGLKLPREAARRPVTIARFDFRRSEDVGGSV
jgi:hypothetical protein